LTQLAFIRLSANPAAFSPAKTPSEAAALLSEMVEDSQHVFVDTLPSAVSSNMWGKILGHQQVTDAYLLMVAAAAGASLLTFDGRLRLLAGSEGRVETLL
jgi:predicted nucleic acid-binding protein